ncbi:MAG TPA: hypothetical protein VKX49_18065 [Bryobacteraceae bacterium]|nr:hypothetical protein [Bryobacteraceae bacterium]
MRRAHFYRQFLLDNEGVGHSSMSTYGLKIEDGHLLDSGGAAGSVVASSAALGGDEPA